MSLRLFGLFRGREHQGCSWGMKKFIVATLLSTTISLVFVLAVIHFAPIADILISHSQYVPTKDFKELDGYEQIVIERLIKEKALLTVDNLWSMQVSFYQTIVSILIALNAAILGIAFVIIKSSSAAEAIKESLAKFDEFSKSPAFTRLVQKKAKREIEKINSTYNDVWDELEIHRTRISGNESAIIVISNRVAALDNSEDSPESSEKIEE